MTRTFDYPNATLGTVTLRVDSRARNVNARWVKGRLRLTVPPSVAASNAGIDSFLERLMPRILAMKKMPDYSDMAPIECPGLRFEFSRQTAVPRGVTCLPRLPMTSIGIGSEIDTGDASATRAVSRALCSCAHTLAPELLLPRAREIADTLGVSPTMWRVGRGLKTLGTCDAKGIITLSSATVFLPQNLRDYIVCHELAHLLEMNHSSRFHSVCSDYCERAVGAPERALTASLRAFPWPILR